MGKVLKVREVGDPILNKECNEVDIKNINKDIFRESKREKWICNSREY